MNDYDALLKQYQDFKSRELNLNMERGQPADSNFDLSLPILGAVDELSLIHI